MTPLKFEAKQMYVPRANTFQDILLSTFHYPTDL